MNTIILIAIPAIVVGIVLFLVGTAIADHIEHVRSVNLRKAEDEKKRINNLLVTKLYNKFVDSNGRGIIFCEYAVGRWFLVYEYQDSELHHFCIVKTFYDDGIPFEHHGKPGLTFGFAPNTNHSMLYEMAESKLLEIIRITNIMRNNN